MLSATSRLAPLTSRLSNWLFQLRGIESGSIVLVQRRIFILPSRHGVLFIAALFMMLTGSVNYNLSLGFVLTFLLGGLGINSILHTFRNLARLEISAGRTQPVFAGETARFSIVVKNPGTLDRYSIAVTRDRKEAAYIDVLARETSEAIVVVPAPQRGVLRPGRLTLFTHFPLGLCYAWAYVELDAACLVYPRPETGVVPLPEPEPHYGTALERGLGGDDFSGLRTYHPGDSPRHIAWKAATREQGLLTKQFSGSADAELWLDWRMLPGTLGTEEKLSRLARWVIDANAAGISIGLRLPHVTITPAPGDVQRERCLEALALFSETGTA